MLDPKDPLAGMSRQLRWKIKRFRAGLCVNCSKPRLKEKGARKESKYKRLCWRCGEDRANKARAKRLTKNHPKPQSDAAGYVG